SILMPPVGPTDRRHNHRGCCQRPARIHSGPPRLHGPVPRPELLPQPHLYPRGSLCFLRFGPHRLQIRSQGLPVLMQRRAARARTQMFPRGAKHRIVSLHRFQVQSRQFKFFARHCRFSCQTLTGSSPRASVCPAASPASPAGAPARGAAANESCPPDNPTAAPPRRNSILPARTAPPLRETPRAASVPLRERVPAARKLPPTRPASSPQMPCLAALWHLRRVLRAAIPAAPSPDVSSRDCA